MSQIEITFSQDLKKSYPAGSLVRDILKDANPAGIKELVAARVNGHLVDFNTTLSEDATITGVSKDSPEGLDILRHSTSHVMAEAVKRLFKDVQVTIGPSIEDGFYYDFDVPTPFTLEDLPKIEQEMAKIISANSPFERRELSGTDAVAFFKQQGENYKVELIQDLGAETVSLYRQGDFTDLCRGPHLPSTGYIRAFKLTSVAGAYWRGDEKRQMLQRIYGTAFYDKDTLKKHLARIEEAKKRDHRKLGRELDLFGVYEEAGAGLIVYHPKGAMLRSLIEDFEKKEHYKRGYELVIGPQLLRLDLWKKSGHYDNYRENMYFTTIDEVEYGIKPMNCLAHMLIYKSKIRSYRDLPKRYFELGTVHRHEKSGVLHGLTRVRQFTQDDAHIICTPEQMNAEIKGVINFVSDVMAMFGFEYETELSTRPVKSIGSDADWELATNALLQALNDKGMPYEINAGDGAFYGPKIDIKLKDALDRRWQCATIQCDFTLPERFDLSYIGADSQKHRPVMLHRVILGSLERFIGVLIEHFAGAFPAWLAPVQAKVVNVIDAVLPYAQEVTDRLRAENFRVELDDRNEKLGLKIRESQMEKIPYTLVIGQREMAEHGVSPRRRGGEDLKFMSVDQFIALLQQEVAQKIA
ncbi:MAG: threonine--tRNA ligase [Deltaproteobacteria bacterium]|nr:threonine--tRNA ligase [Deltaproteobacteria bacterium]